MKKRSYFKKKCLIISTMMMFLSIYVVNAFANDYVYDFYGHQGQQYLEVTKGGKNWGDEKAFLKAIAHINEADNTVGITLERLDNQLFEAGTIYLQSDSWDNYSPYFQAVDNVDNDLSKSLVSKDSLVTMIAEWSGDYNGGVMHIYGRYIGSEGTAWVGPITIQRTRKSASSHLRVIIQPTEAQNDGAMWRPQGSIKWYESAELTEDAVYEGEMTIEFRQIPQYGWANMPDMKVVLIGSVTEVDAIYQTAGKGCLQVFTEPEDVGSFRYWLTNIGTWSGKFRSGHVICNLDPGPLKIDFEDVPRWMTPSPSELFVTIEESKTTVYKGLYCREFPDPPMNVKASDGLSTDHILIVWDSNICDLEYVVYRGTQNNASDPEVIALTDKFVGNSFVDDTADPGVEYYYWVTAHTLKGESQKSMYDTGYLQLKQPANVVATDRVHEGFIRVSFDAVPGAREYQIWRLGTEPGAVPATPAYAQYVTTITGLTFDDDFPIYEKPYYYWVKAVNDLTKSDYSPYPEFGSRRMPVVEYDIIASEGTYINKIVVTYEPIGNEKYHGIQYTFADDQGGNNRKRSLNSVKTVQNSPGTLTDDNPIPWKVYFYRIQAYNQYNSDPTKDNLSISSHSNGGYARMEPVPNLSATQNSDLCTVHVNWDPVTFAEKYFVWRNTSNDKDSAINITEQGIDATFYANIGIGRSYFYWIEARNAYSTPPSKTSWSPTYQIGIPSVCEYEPSISEITFDKNGGQGSFRIIPSDNAGICSWKVSSTNDWINSIVPKAGQGEQTITFNVNPSNIPLSGSIEISGDNSSSCNDDVSSVSVDLTVNYELNINGNSEIEVNGDLKQLPSSSLFSPDETVNLKSICQDGYIFDSWSGDASGSDSSIVVTMDSDKEVTANCVETVDLCLGIKGKGIVTVDNDITINTDTCFTMAKESDINLQASPESEDISIVWSGDAQGDDEMISLTMDTDKSITVTFLSPGWSFNITSTRGDSSPFVTLGVRADGSVADAPPFPPDYETSILINRYYEKDWDSTYFIDIKEESQEESPEYYWGLSINPAGKSGPLEYTTLVTWNSKMIDPDNELRCELIEGYEKNGNVLIPDMKAISQMEVTGGKNDQYFTVHCFVPPEHPVIKCKDTETDSSVTVLFDTGETASEKAAEALTTDYPFDCVLRPITGDESDWSKRLEKDIKKQGDDFYIWILAVNPKGTDGAPNDDGSVVLNWDLSSFNEGNVGYWKLYESYDGATDYNLKIGDMKITKEMTVTGDSSYQYFSIVWHRDWALNLKTGWNLVSLAVTPVDNTLKSMIPDASVAYEFRDGGYHLVEFLNPTIGYWVKVPTDKTYYIKGDTLSAYSKTLETGWNLVGSVMGLAAPISVPENCIEAVFSYGNGSYKLAKPSGQDNWIFEEGLGYWVKATESCELTAETQ